MSSFRVVLDVHSAYVNESAWTPPRDIIWEEFKYMGLYGWREAMDNIKQQEWREQQQEQQEEQGNSTTGDRFV